MILSRQRISMDQAIKKLVEEFSEYIKEIYLYGSCARGESEIYIWRRIQPELSF